MSRPPRRTGRPGTARSSDTRAAVGTLGLATDERRSLLEAARLLDLELDDHQVGLLLDYLALLRKWNAVYNLTAIRDPGAMLVQHLFDCLAIVPALRHAPLAADRAPGLGPPERVRRDGDSAPTENMPQRSSPPNREHSPNTEGSSGSEYSATDENAPRDLLAPGAVVLDVGSGGGLPGVVLAICAPGVRVWCVDAVGKKAAFLTQVRADLPLPNLHAIHARVEQLQAPRDLPAPTLVVSRAFASLDSFVALTRHLIAAGGTWAAMKGQSPDDELRALAPDVRRVAAITLTVPRLDAQRRLVLLRA